jgi:hypothetical protein
MQQSSHLHIWRFFSEIFNRNHPAMYPKQNRLGYTMYNLVATRVSMDECHFIYSKNNKRTAAVEYIHKYIERIYEADDSEAKKELRSKKLSVNY